MQYQGAVHSSSQTLLCVALTCVSKRQHACLLGMVDQASGRRSMPVLVAFFR